MPVSPVESVAWVLALGGRLRAAVSEREFVHLLETPTLIEVPMSPAHCRHVVAWNDMLLPVMDLSIWLHGQPLEGPRPIAGVFASSTHTPRPHGAMAEGTRPSVGGSSIGMPGAVTEA